MQESTDANDKLTTTRPNSGSRNNLSQVPRPRSKTRQRHRSLLKFASLTNTQTARPRRLRRVRRATVRVTEVPSIPRPKVHRKRHSRQTPQRPVGSPNKKRLNTLGFVVPTWNGVDVPGDNGRSTQSENTFTKVRDSLDIEYDKGKLPKQKLKQRPRTVGRNPFQDFNNRSWDDL